MRKVVYSHWEEGHCWSLFEGCACHGDEGHEGLHWCEGGHIEPYPNRIEWTDEQAQEWEKEI